MGLALAAAPGRVKTARCGVLAHCLDALPPEVVGNI